MTVLRKITAAALAGLVATASPVWAESYGTPERHSTTREDQIGALLFGLTALAVIAGLASNNDRDKDDDRGDGRVIVAPPAPVTPSTNPDHIPARCLHTIQTVRGPAPLYTRACLREHYLFIDSLPRHCFVETRNLNGHKRFGWSPYCLSQAGYDVRY